MKELLKELNVRTKRKIYSFIIAVLIILLTGFWTNCEVCFVLHALPWGIGFAEGMSWSIVGYYLILTIILSMLVYTFIRPRTR